MRWRSVCLAVAFCTGWIVITIAAILFAPVHAEQLASVVSQSATTIGKSQTVEDVAVIGNDALIFGKVTDTVIVINGNTHLGPAARVDTVIDIGGDITRDPGAQVSDVFRLSMGSTVRNSLLIGSALVLGLWAARLVLSVGMIVVPLLLSVLLKKWLTTPLAYVEQSARRTGVIGLLVTVAVLAVSGLLILTVIGIPVAVLIVAIYGFAGLLGWTIVAGWIGRLETFSSMKNRELWVQSIIGATLMMAFSNVPLVGLIIALALWVTGIGAVVLWISNILRGRKTKFEAISK